MPFVYSIDFVVDSFPCGNMCRVWNLIVSVPDIAFLSFQAICLFRRKTKKALFCIKVIKIFQV